VGGTICYEAVGRAWNLPSRPVEEVLEMQAA